jgi:hypothetical protein
MHGGKVVRAGLSKRPLTNARLTSGPNYHPLLTILQPISCKQKSIVNLVSRTVTQASWSRAGLIVSVQPDGAVGWAGIILRGGVHHYGIGSKEFSSIEDAKESAIGWAYARGILDPLIEIRTFD